MLLCNSCQLYPSFVETAYKMSSNQIEMNLELFFFSANHKMSTFFVKTCENVWKNIWKAAIKKNQKTKHQQEWGLQVKKEKNHF